MVRTSVHEPGDADTVPAGDGHAKVEGAPPVSKRENVWRSGWSCRLLTICAAPALLFGTQWRWTLRQLEREKAHRAKLSEWSGALELQVERLQEVQRSSELCYFVTLPTGEGFGYALYNHWMLYAYAASSAARYLYEPTPDHGGHGLNSTMFAEFSGVEQLSVALQNCRNMTNVDPASLGTSFWGSPFLMPHMHTLVKEEDPRRLFTADVRWRLRHAYNVALPKPAPCASHAAIHFRAGDVAPLKGTRWVPLSFYIKLVKAIQERHPDWMITIFSKGEPSDFGELQHIPGCKLALGGDFREAFHGMVTANVLFTAQSWFSLAAAMITFGEVYYFPNSGPQPLDHWRSVTEFGVSPEGA